MNHLPPSVPVENVTLDRKPSISGYWRLRVNGTVVAVLHGGTLNACGIPAPRPRVGPLGISEHDTRVVAESGSATSDRPWDRAHNAMVAACRDAVAEWDREDAS